MWYWNGTFGRNKTWTTDVLKEGVSTGSYHHDDFFQRISTSSELCPVNTVLVTATVMPSTVPHAIQVGMSTGVIPPSSLLVVGTVPWTHKYSNESVNTSKTSLLLHQGIALVDLIKRSELKSTLLFQSNACTSQILVHVRIYYSAWTVLERRRNRPKLKFFFSCLLVQHVCWYLLLVLIFLSI